MFGRTPFAATPCAAFWPGVAGLPAGVVFPLREQGNGPQVWLVEIGAQADTAGSGPAPVGLIPFGMTPFAAPDRPAGGIAGGGATTPVVRVSDRGWIGEPDDALAPNTPYSPRLTEPPALEASLPLYPDAARRLALTAGEVRLLNGDGALDTLAGDWSIGGQPVVLRQGPHTRPRHAPLASFVEIATLRAAGAAAGTSRLAIPLRPAAADLEVPACATYGGTGGIEGDASLAGQFKPALYGRKHNVEPVMISASYLVFHLHAGPIQALLAVRDRGVALTDAGDLANWSALIGASVAPGSFKTCRALGLVRVGTTPSGLTVDAEGDNDASTGGYNAGSAPGIAQKLLQGPGNIASADGNRFAWPVGEAGLWLRGGSVAAALDTLAAGVFGWWGTDAQGVYYGGQLLAPEAQAPGLVIEPWMLAAPPEEIGPARAPWWRVRVGYDGLGRIQADEQLAGAVSAADRARWGQAWRVATAADTGIFATYPTAADGPEIVSVLAGQADAQSLADQCLALFGRPRRLFQARVRAGAGGFAWPTMALGACVALRWPQHRALAAGRPLVVQGVSTRGDATTLTLWG